MVRHKKNNVGKKCHRDRQTNLKPPQKINEKYK